MKSVLFFNSTKPKKNIPTLIKSVLIIAYMIATIWFLNIIKCNIINEIIDYIIKNKYEINEFILFLKEKNNIYYNDLFDVINSTKEPILTYSNVLQFCNIIFSKKLQSAPLLQAMRDCFGGHMFELENFNEKIHANWLE